MKSVVLQVLAVIFSALTMTAALPNEIYRFGFPLLAAICLVPLYYVLHASDSCRKISLYIALHILCVHLSSSFWLANFRGYGIFSLGASAFGTALIGFTCGIIFCGTRRFSSRFLKKDSLFQPLTRALTFALWWVLWEYFKSVDTLGYPWGTLSMAAYNFKLITQIADITGVWGITFLYALVNAFAGELYIRFTRSGSGLFTPGIRILGKCTAFLAVISLVYGTFQYFIPGKPEKHINTVIVQQNMDPWNASESDSIILSKKLTDEAIERFEENNLKCDLVLWSEGVLSSKFPSARYHYRDFPSKESLSSYIKRKGVPFLIGGETRVNPEKRHNSNSAIFFDAQGNYSGFYSKIHLVPFAEGVPYSHTDLMKFIMQDIVHYGSGGWTPGYQFVLFSVPVSESKDIKTPLEYNQPVFSRIFLDENGKSNSETTERYITNSQRNPSAFVNFTAPICFEDSFTDVLRPLFLSGSEVFMNITNDSWSMMPSAEYQHFVAASYAAICYRTTMVRCCNSGYSSVILPNGKILADLPVFTEGSLAVSVPVYRRRLTLYALYGDWLAGYAAAFVFIVILMNAAVFYAIPRKITDLIKKYEKNFALRPQQASSFAASGSGEENPAAEKKTALPERKAASVKAAAAEKKKASAVRKAKVSEKAAAAKTKKSASGKPASGKKTAAKTSKVKKPALSEKKAASVKTATAGKKKASPVRKAKVSEKAAAAKTKKAASGKAASAAAGKTASKRSGK